MTHPRRAAGGAALLTALVIVALVATMAAAMVWQQWRAVQVESAERARTQAQWILTGALDWARLILREDAKSGSNIDHLGEPWATPLAEARLSSFLAVDKENTDDAPEAFLSGSIADLQARYNLRNLIDAQGQVIPEQLRLLQQLCELAGVSPALASGLASNLQQALLAAEPQMGADAASAGATGQAGAGQPAPVTRTSNPPLMPPTFDQLSWLGLDAMSIEKLAPYVVLLPEATKVNLNTASKEVIAAAIPGLDLGSAERLVQARQRNPLTAAGDAGPLMGRGQLPQGSMESVDVSSNYFEVRGRLRFEDRVVMQRFLVKRAGQAVVTLYQVRSAGLE